jgi:hypothetical protein
MASQPSETWAHSENHEVFEEDGDVDAMGEVDVETGASSRKPDEAPTSNASGTAPKRKRPLKLTASQRERKRAIDREAQRSIRIKTKNYIAHLESLVKAMDHNDGTGADGENNRTRELMNQLRQSQEEVRRLREAMLGVQRALGGVLSDAPKAGGVDQQDGRQHSSSASPPSGGEQVPGVMGGSFSTSARPSIDAGGGAFWLPPQDINAVPPAPSIAVASEQASPGSMLPQRPNKDPSLRAFEGEMFYYAEYHLSRVYAAPGPGAFSNRPFDEDIIIRAVIEGWPAVEERYPLDLGWQVLQEIDQVIFPDCGIVERMAALRLCRMKLLHVANTKAGAAVPGPNGIPNYMTNEVLAQQDNRMHVVDNFVWPGFRKLLLESPQRYINNEFNESFRHNLKFLWPFELADTYTKDPVTSLYCSTPEFMRRQADIRCWTMKRVFFNGYEELWETIPAYEAEIQKSLPAPVPMGTTAPSHPGVRGHSHSMGMVEDQEVDEEISEGTGPPSRPVLRSNVDESASWIGQAGAGVHSQSHQHPQSHAHQHPHPHLQTHPQTHPHTSPVTPIPTYWSAAVDPNMGGTPFHRHHSHGSGYS